MPVAPSEGFLVKKAGPLPVWGWAGIGLGGAYLYSKHKAGASASTSSTAATTSASGEPSTGGPEYVIENNVPGGYGSPSAPIPTPVTAPPATTTTGTTPSPPTNTPIPGGGTPVPVTASPAKTTTRATYTVVTGDNLTTIAKKYGTTAASLFAYNTTPGVRPAATIATLKQRGPNLIYAGEKILIPSS